MTKIHNLTVFNFNEPLLGCPISSGVRIRITSNHAAEIFYESEDTYDLKHLTTHSGRVAVFAKNSTIWAYYEPHLHRTTIVFAEPEDATLFLLRHS